jgi:Domain of unknown function DUF29
MLVTTLYEQDFYAWSQVQVKLLREGRLNELDIANLSLWGNNSGKSYLIAWACF